MFTVLATGNWLPNQVRTTWTADTRLRIAAVEQSIEATWAEALAQPGIKLFDGPMCRLESWRVAAGELQLVLSPTSYKTFMGTNLAHGELADQFGREVLANPVGLSAALITADEFLILGRRNAAVAYYPSRIHPFAGCLEPRDSGEIFAAVRRELAEELSFGPMDIADIRCIGLIEDNALRQPEIIFRVRTHRTRLEVERQVDGAEHLASYAIAATRAEIEQAMANSELTPVARGAILLWGNAEWGGH